MKRTNKHNDNIELEVFMDSGAPSLYNQFSKTRKAEYISYSQSEEFLRYKEAYIEYMRRNEGRIPYYSNLDIIRNAELTWENQKELENAGLNPMPIFHLSNDEKYLRYYAKYYDTIGIGGITPNKPKDLFAPLDRIFNDYLTDSKGFPVCRVHGFGCTSVSLMVRYPWISVDSSSCRKLAGYGKVYLPTPGDVFRTSHIRVTDRGGPLENKIPGKILERLRDYAESKGISLDSLMTDGMPRQVLNTLYFEDVIDCLPNYPWSFKTRESKKGSTQKLKFYSAGGMKNLEEEKFWKMLMSRTKNVDMGYRLYSYWELPPNVETLPHPLDKYSVKKY